MESLQLKKLYFGLQKRTGPSSDVVASIVLVFPGLDGPGVSLAEVCGGVTCGSLVIRDHRTIFLNLELLLFKKSSNFVILATQTKFIVSQARPHDKIASRLFCFLSRDDT